MQTQFTNLAIVLLQLTPLSFSSEEIHPNRGIRTSNSLKCLSFNVTYSPAHCGITQNEEADRLAKVGAQAAQKMIKG